MISRINQILLFSALACMFLGCAGKKEPAGLIKPAYFDLETIIDNQVKELSRQNAGAIKSNTTNKVPEESKTVSDINWQRELEMFRQAGINRPAWRNEFTTDSSSKSGIKTVTYRRKQGSDAPVEYLQVLFATNNIAQQLSAKLRNDNMLFSNSKIIEMHFDTTGHHLLRRYSITGSEKMVLAEEVNYNLRGEVLL